jgi:hypothetical protein
MHQSIPQQGKWLRQVVTGYYNYHAVPTNSRALEAFRYHVIDLWRRTLRRCSQKDGSTWERIARIAHDWLSKPRILHPWPQQRFAIRHPRWEPYAGMPHVRICAGGAHSYRNSEMRKNPKSRPNSAEICSTAVPAQPLRHHHLAVDVDAVNLKHRLRQIETNERRGYHTISLMKTSCPSCGTALPETGDVHLITLHLALQYQMRRPSISSMQPKTLPPKQAADGVRRQYASPQPHGLEPLHGRNAY